jgi:hypothetical protein
MAPQNIAALDNAMGTFMNSFFHNGIQRLDNKKTMLENGQFSLDYNKSMDGSNAYCKDMVLKNGFPSSSLCLSNLPHQLKPIKV